MLKIVSKHKPTESEIQKAILGYLTIKRIFHYRQNQGTIKTDRDTYYKATSINGIPDIICIKDGIYIGLEVKTSTGKLNANQIETHKRIQAAGGLVFVVRSLDDVRKIFEGG